jgi:hypothetical protein
MIAADKIIYALSAAAVMVVGGLLIADQIDARDKQIHANAYSLGYNTAVQTGAPTTVKCMEFWFSGDPQKVGKALKSIKKGGLL